MDKYLDGITNRDQSPEDTEPQEAPEGSKDAEAPPLLSGDQDAAAVHDAMHGIYVDREEFDLAVEAVWSEIEYQNQLPRRTFSDEARDIPGFLTLGRVYLAKAEAEWAGTKARILVDMFPYTPANETIRKLAAIFVRGMIYTGIRHRITAEKVGTTEGEANNG